MSCELYWREGIVRVERGERDLHRDGCADCQREHLAREAIIRALPWVAADELGDPNWEIAVWARIARQESVQPRLRWFLGSMAATACVLILASWAILRDGGGRALIDSAPLIELAPGSPAMRSAGSTRLLSAATVGDQIRITAKTGDQIRVYHGDQLWFACPGGTTSGGCVSNGHGLVAEAKLEAPGPYALVVVMPDLAQRKTMPRPGAGLEKDLIALTDAGCNYQLTQVWVP